MAREGASWFANYARHPWMMIAPALGFRRRGGGVRGAAAGREVVTFIASKLAVVGIISTVGLSMFPFILPSSIDPELQPDGVGLGVEPLHALQHAGRRP